MKIIDTYKAGRYVSLILSEKLPFKPLFMTANPILREKKYLFY